MRSLLAILLTLLLASSALAADFTGPVTYVLDGDTLEVTRNHRNVKIRLNGIDTPEKGQAYGHKATEFVVLQAFGKEVTVQTFGLDKYGRTIGDVYLPDGTLLNKELVKAGLAWRYCKYSADRTLAQLEIEAREGAAQHNHAVTLDGDGVDAVGGARARIEAEIC